MFMLFKAGCLVIYAAALAQWAGWLPATILPYAIWIALALLVVHALELPFVMRAVRLYPGPLAVSVLLTLLYGLLHWMPLKRASQKAALLGEPS